MPVELGVPGQLVPPADRAIEYARRFEADGFDAVWWPDRLMGWLPASLWTADVTPLAASQANPHLAYDPLVMMGAVGPHLERMRVGVVVTDVQRRHPAVLAQTMLTIDHLTHGRAILGLGPGETLNLVPYGIPFERPVARLAEAIEVIRLLWSAEGPVDWQGRFFRLDGAVLGLAPYGAPPPIWLAAHGPRMLELTARLADGWLPTRMTVDEYSAALGRIREAARAAGRAPGAVTPGMLAYVLAAPDEQALDRLVEHPLIRCLCLLVDGGVYRRAGFEPPLGDGASGWYDLVPASLDRNRALALASAVPPAMVRRLAFCGTPEQIREQIAPYERVGLRHLVFWNVTPLGDPGLTRWSFDALRAVRACAGS